LPGQQGPQLRRLMTSQFAVLRRAESLGGQAHPDDGEPYRAGNQGHPCHRRADLQGGPTRLTSGPRSLSSSVRSTSLGKRSKATCHLRMERSRAPCLPAFVASSEVPSSSRVTGRVTDPSPISPRSLRGYPSAPRPQPRRLRSVPAIPTTGLAPSGGIIPSVRINGT
jgi:hypothetical protein